MTRNPMIRSLIRIPSRLSGIAVAFAALLLALPGGQPVAQATAEPGTAPQITPDYRIAAEDVLDIAVWREPDLARKVVVRPDGGFSFPLVGDVQAAGLTPAELEATLRTRLATFIPDAVVTVSVQELRGLRIYVTGKVRSPGQYQVGRYVDVLQAVTLAGGFTPFANTRKVQIIRRDAQGRETIFRFNYNEVQKGRNLAQNIQLQADDVVLIP
jgi:polysaccharide export outer membrane protein